MDKAANHAGISSTTLGRIERGENIEVRHDTYAKIEQVIGWDAGSITRILDGGDPIPAATGTSHAGHNGAVSTDYITTWETELLDEIWDLERHPDWTRAERQEATDRLRVKVAE